MGRHSITRRSYMGGTVAAIGAGLAGCLGDFGDDSGDDSDDSGDDSGDDNGDDSGGYPERDLELVVPTPPGTGHDRYGRGVAEILPEHLPNDVDIAVQNAEGAGQLRGINQVLDADPDGHTFGIAGDLAAAIHYMTGELDTGLDEWSYIGRALEEHLVMCTAPDSGLETFDDLRDLDTLTVAAGDPHHSFLIPFLVLAELTGLQDEVEIDLITGHENVGERVSTVLAGDAHIYQSAITSAGTRAQIADGEVHPVLWYGTDELEEAPDTPTVEDIGYPELSDVGSRQRMFFAAPDTDDESLTTLQDSFVDTVNSQDFEDWAEESGDPVDPGGPDETSESAIATFEALQDYEHIFA